MAGILSRLFIVVSVVVFAVVVATFSAKSRDRVETGLLDCIVEGGSGFIFKSTKDLRCEFRRINGDIEPYFGVIRKYGVDIGSTSGGIIRWVVLAPTLKVDEGALSGNYAGISAEATVGVGLGANALIGGFDSSIALQPFSVQSQQGLNFAVGVAELELRSAF